MKLAAEVLRIEEELRPLDLAGPGTSWDFGRSCGRCFGNPLRLTVKHIKKYLFSIAFVGSSIRIRPYLP